MNRPFRYLPAQRHGPLWMLCVSLTSVIALAAAAALSGCGGGA